jgi:hypothetical protein
MLTDAEIDGYIESNPARAPRRARHGARQRTAVYEQISRRRTLGLTLPEPSSSPRQDGID